MPDREKVIKALEETIPFLDSRGYGGAAHTVYDALALLKEQETVVRCKDCKHYMTMHCNCGGCFISDDWYCADGERTDNDA